MCLILRRPRATSSRRSASSSNQRWMGELARHNFFWRQGCINDVEKSIKSKSKCLIWSNEKQTSHATWTLDIKICVTCVYNSYDKFKVQVMLACFSINSGQTFWFERTLHVFSILRKLGLGSFPRDEFKNKSYTVQPTQILHFVKKKYIYIMLFSDP